MPPVRTKRDNSAVYTQKELRNAIETGDLRRVKRCLDNGVPVNAFDWNEWTPLIGAVRKQNISLVRLLHARGANVNRPTADETSPLAFAVETGNIEIIQFLCDNGADVNARSKCGETVLSCAARRGNPLIAAFLCDKGADVNAYRVSGFTSLHSAAAFLNPNVVSVLCDRGADVNTRDCHGCTPLMISVMFFSAASAQILLDRGANINTHTNIGNTPLIRAVGCTLGDVFKVRSDRWSRDGGAHPMRPVITVDEFNRIKREIVQMLCDEGADVNAFNHDGNTPLCEALHNEDIDMAQFLIDRGANVNQATPKDSEIPLTLAIRKRNLDAVRLLLARGANANQPNQEGYEYPITLALKKGHSGITQLLLESGANAKQIDHMGRLPITVAAEHGNSDSISCLVKYGADVNQIDESYATALIAVASQPDGENLIRQLHLHGADLNKHTPFNQTPLIEAITHDRFDNVRVLCELGADIKHTNVWSAIINRSIEDRDGKLRLLRDLGADVNIIDQFGNMPIHNAIESGNKEDVLTLCELGAKVNHPGSGGIHPIDAARTGKLYSIIRILVGMGSDPSLTRYGDRYMQRESRKIVRAIQLGRKDRLMSQRLDNTAKYTFEGAINANSLGSILADYAVDWKHIMSLVDAQVDAEEAAAVGGSW